jgi:7-cyano-7-deazaguanine synthase
MVTSIKNNNRNESEMRESKMHVPQKSLLLLSGGPDSTTLAYFLKEQGVLFQALTFDLGEECSNRQIEYAKKIIQRLNVPHTIVDLHHLKEFLNLSFTETLLTNPSPRVLPFGSSIVLSASIVYALRNNFSKIFIAANKEDAEFSKEYSKEYYDFWTQLVEFSVNRRISIEAPFINLTKAQILKMGKEYGVPFELTWSCLRGGRFHCGKCSGCKHRIKAFREAGIRDPTIYEGSGIAKLNIPLLVKGRGLLL